MQCDDTYRRHANEFMVVPADFGTFFLEMLVVGSSCSFYRPGCAHTHKRQRRGANEDGTLGLDGVCLHYVSAVIPLLLLLLPLPRFQICILTFKKFNLRLSAYTAWQREIASAHYIFLCFQWYYMIYFSSPVVAKKNKSFFFPCWSTARKGYNCA